MPATTPRVVAVLVGLVLALAVFLVVRALHAFLFPGEPFGIDWINAFALAVAGAALEMSWAERTGAARAGRPARPVVACLAAAIAALSVCAYEGLGSVQFPYHRWEHFTYYIGAKRSEEHTSELQSRRHLVCRLLREKKKNVPVITLPTLIRERRYATR